MTRTGFLDSFFICRVASYALLCFSLYNLLPGGFICIEAANDNNQYNVGDDHYVGHVDVEMNFDGYGDDPSRKHPPGLNPSQQEQILKKIEEEIRRQQPGAGDSKKAKIKLGTKGGEQVFHKSGKKAKKPSINEYKQWVKQSQRQPKGYLDVASVGALFTNKFSKFIFLAIFITGSLIALSRYCEDNQRAYEKKYQAYLRRKAAKKKIRRNVGRHSIQIGKNKVPRIPLKSF